MKYKGLILSAFAMIPLQQLKAEVSEDVVSLNEKIEKMQRQIDLLTANQKQKNIEITTTRSTNPIKAYTFEKESTSDQTKLKFYGNVRVDAAYDFKGSTNSIGNKIGSQPLNNTDPIQNKLNVSAATSRFGIDITKPTSNGDLVGKLEADFMGSNGDNGNGSVRVRHAYLSLGNWLIGQTTSPFVNNSTAPNLVDFTGAIGTGTQRNVQVRYQQLINNKQKIQFALEGGDIENDNVQGGSRFPALTMNYELKNEKLLLQLHGMLHEVRAISETNNEQKELAWGAGLGAKLNLNANDSIVFNYYHVVGNNRYMSYSKDNDAFYYGEKGVVLSEFDSAEVGYMKKWNSKLRSSFSLGGIWYEDNSLFSEFNPNQNKQLINASANLLWQPIENVDFGMEYTYGQRTTFSGMDGDLSRINLMTKYSF
ncbi:DcaP family trimeric outer membrane transporter [Acinetobacter pittii]|uniref:DcaP family trimeric outer membrane transporter n=1 Tax=Acinetobacter pittii TaxID=48296 RepID=UPI003AF468BF